jgi:hypothetical protein
MERTKRSFYDSFFYEKRYNGNRGDFKRVSVAVDDYPSAGGICAGMRRMPPPIDFGVSSSASTACFMRFFFCARRQKPLDLLMNPAVGVYDRLPAVWPEQRQRASRWIVEPATGCKTPGL